MNRAKFVPAALIALAVLRVVEAAEIHEAATAGDLDKIKALVGATPPLVNARDEPNGFPPLMDAAYAGQTTAVVFLLAQKADIRLTSKDGLTALHFAAWGGSSDATELLLKAGMDVNAKSAQGLAPLHLAVAYAGAEHRDVVNLLLARGADVNAKNNAGETLLHAAALNGDQELAVRLLAIGAEVDPKNQEIGTKQFLPAISMHNCYS